MRILICLFISSIISVKAFAWNEKIANISENGINALKVHTSHHETTAARPISLILISGLEGTCSKGVWFDSTVNQTAHSVALAALAAKSSIQITYNLDDISPWGNPQYCALTGIQLNK